MNLSAENIQQIRELVRSGYPLKARDAKDLQGHNDHLTELLEARFRLMLSVEIERDQLKAEVDSLTREADRQYTTIEAYRHDAERYRFLCEKFGETKLPCALERILSGDLYVADGKPSIDLAIDTAMSKAVQP
ncbi:MULTISPECIES: hypothetical protein [Pseudomonas]|uniref:hypothetical protein n=1 Tax=Pseudomonas TaxID=286 RepID=UPI00078BC90C|nr:MULTISPECIES: hypothetical protein [Pseudomonas]AMT88386.1 hypothetical protein AYO71_12820 [Pseudomonas koreensis]AMT89833.1 hypothetical protein AYO71_20650 [Pseudomonas koreensis]TSB52408.1 hypothetical protein FEE99_09355 [Pseudomonas sp. ef1]